MSETLNPKDFEVDTYYEGMGELMVKASDYQAADKLAKYWENKTGINMKMARAKVKVDSDRIKELEKDLVDKHKAYLNMFNARDSSLGRIADLEKQQAQWKRERDILLKMTEDLDEHPEGYEGPCLCKLCISYGD